MKVTVLLLGALLLATAVHPQPAANRESAQTDLDSIQIGSVYGLGPGGRFVALESTSAQERGALHEILGSRSPVRLEPQNAVQFWLRARTQAEALQFQLYAFRSNTGNRRETNAKTDLITVTVTKVREGIFALAPSRRLSAGEYGFSPSTSNDVFAFRVEANVDSTVTTTPAKPSKAPARTPMIRGTVTIAPSLKEDREANMVARFLRDKWNKQLFFELSGATNSTIGSDQSILPLLNLGTFAGATNNDSSLMHNCYDPNLNNLSSHSCPTASPTASRRFWKE